MTTTPNSTTASSSYSLHALLRLPPPLQSSCTGTFECNHIEEGEEGLKKGEWDTAALGGWVELMSALLFRDKSRRSRQSHRYTEEWCFTTIIRAKHHKTQPVWSTRVTNHTTQHSLQCYSNSVEETAWGAWNLQVNLLNRSNRCNQAHLFAHRFLKTKV